MHAARIVGVIALLTATAALATQGEPLADEPVAEPAAPTAADVVAARQSAFHLSAVTLGGLRGALESGAPIKQQVFAARGLARWAAVLPQLFPDSTKTITPSRAKPEIWTDKAGFTAKADDYKTATEALVNAALADDKTAFTAALVSTAGTCKACHDSYQTPPPPKPAG